MVIYRQNKPCTEQSYHGLDVALATSRGIAWSFSQRPWVEMQDAADAGFLVTDSACRFRLAEIVQLTTKCEIKLLRSPWRHKHRQLRRASCEAKTRLLSGPIIEICLFTRSRHGVPNCTSSRFMHLSLRSDNNPHERHQCHLAPGFPQCILCCVTWLPRCWQRSFILRRYRCNQRCGRMYMRRLKLPSHVSKNHCC